MQKEAVETVVSIAIKCTCAYVCVKVLACEHANKYDQPPECAHNLARTLRNKHHTSAH